MLQFNFSSFNMKQTNTFHQTLSDLSPIYPRDEIFVNYRVYCSFQDYNSLWVFWRASYFKNMFIRLLGLRRKLFYNT